MILKSLLLRSFKNYYNSFLEFNPKFNFIYGENGQGKTNILESISMLCFTRSFLMTPDKDCVMHGHNDFDIEGIFKKNDLLEHLKFTFSKEPITKRIFFNNDNVKKYQELIGLIPIVILSPQDSSVITGLPGERRKSFDILISQFSKSYLKDLKTYNRIIHQKNFLLKQNLIRCRYSESELNQMIETWNVGLVETGTRIIKKRIQTIKEFETIFNDIFKSITGLQYEPLIEYHCNLLPEENTGSVNEEIIEINFINKLSGSLNYEKKRGVSLIGPHKDEYRFLFFKNKSLFDLKLLGSIGEQKAFLIALKFAEYYLLKQKKDLDNNLSPILLLDDLYSELDDKRKDNITSQLNKFEQIFLTTTDKNYFNYINKYFSKDDILSLKINNGNVEGING
jgi:DNA replication and repair protein RecF